MFKINIFDKISFLMVIIGSLNWGIIGLFNINLFNYLTNGSNIIIRSIYIIIFLSAIDLIYLLLKARIIKFKI